MAYCERFARSGLDEKRIKDPTSGETTLRIRAGRPYRLTDSDLADLVRLIEHKLAWYGFTSVKVGPFITIQGRKILIYLLDRGQVLCRLELDPGTKPFDGSGLATLMNSLRGEAHRKMHEINPAA